MLECLAGGPVGDPVLLVLAELLDPLEEQDDPAQAGGQPRRRAGGRRDWERCGRDELQQLQALEDPLRLGALAVVPVELVLKALPGGPLHDRLNPVAARACRHRCDRISPPSPRGREADAARVARLNEAPVARLERASWDGDPRANRGLPSRQLHGYLAGRRAGPSRRRSRSGPRPGRSDSCGHTSETRHVRRMLTRNQRRRGWTCGWTSANSMG